MTKKLCDIADAITRCCTESLGEFLTGIYLHGSLAFGCFHWESSDIDFIIVVREPPTLQQKVHLMQGLLAIESQCPPKGMEMSLVLEKDCRAFRYPTPYALHFSAMYREKCRADVEKFCREMHGVDRDLAAHFTVIRQVGIPLIGPPPQQVFGEVPAEAYRDSILRDIANAEREIPLEPVYLVLNLCRVLAYEREGLVLSKEAGGQWGAEHLPSPEREIAVAARESYRSGAPLKIEDSSLRAFAKELLKRIGKTE